MKYSINARALRQQKKEPVTYSTYAVTEHLIESKHAQYAFRFLGPQGPILKLHR